MDKLDFYLYIAIAAAVAGALKAIADVPYATTFILYIFVLIVHRETT